MGRRRTLSPEGEQWLIANYPHMTNEEIGRHLGIKKSVALRYRRRYDLRKTPETRRRSRMVGAEKVHRRWVLERFRVRSGQPRQTKMRIRRLSDAGYKHRSNMILHYNYFSDPDDITVLCYDEQTDRRPRCEATARRHGIAIVPADE